LEQSSLIIWNHIKAANSITLEELFLTLAKKWEINEESKDGILSFLQQLVNLGALEIYEEEIK
jgi:hypothetical protein